MNRENSANQFILATSIFLYTLHSTFELGVVRNLKKQSITGYEIMTSIRPRYLRSTLTERFNGYEVCIVLQNANALPCVHLNGQPDRR